MQKLTGITKFYDHFIGYLRKKAEFIAPIQFSGRLEDFLVHQFAFFVYLASKGERAAYTNFGKKGEQIIDIAIIQKKNKSKRVKGLIEAKYFRNIHRDSNKNANDETTNILKSLKKQLHKVRTPTYGGKELRLSSKNNEIYGLVFASFVSDKPTENVTKRKTYLKNILSKANDFRFHDLQKPRFDTVYEDIKVKWLDTNWVNSLYVGLWRRK